MWRSTFGLGITVVALSAAAKSSTLVKVDLVEQVERPDFGQPEGVAAKTSRSPNVGLARLANFANMPPNARISDGSDDYGK
jgi:hypothetical protein